MVPMKNSTQTKQKDRKTPPKNVTSTTDERYNEQRLFSGGNVRAKPKCAKARQLDPLASLYDRTKHT